MPELDPSRHVKRVLELAKIANKAGTFAVGGLLIDSTGSVLKEAHNKVIHNGQLWDPTAHAERQLISWYYEASHSGQCLPPPSELTIITSLDPCLMCTGAIIESRINVVVVAHDDIGGLNWKRNNDMLAVPDMTRPAAKQQIAYFGVDDGSRPFIGPSNSIFAGKVIEKDLVEQSSGLAVDSINKVRRINRRVNESSTEDSVAGSSYSVATLLQKHYDKAIKLKINIKNARDRASLLREMSKVAEASQATGGSFESAALIDNFQNVLLILGSTPLSICRIDTPLMRLSQVYASCRRSQRSDQALPHPSQCSVILLNGPAQNALSLMDLGVFGLTMGPSESPQKLYYFHSAQSEHDLAEMISNLPPVFRNVMKITPTKLEET